MLGMSVIFNILFTTVTFLLLQLLFTNLKNFIPTSQFSFKIKQIQFLKQIIQNLFHQNYNSKNKKKLQ